MHPIFFAWSGTYDDLLGTFFHTGASHIRVVHVDDEPHSKYVGFMESSATYRNTLRDLHDNFTLLPGPHGKLSKKHADAINAVLPDLKVKEGDSLESTLLHVHGLYEGLHEFHPNNY